MDGPRFGEGSAVFKVELTRPGRFSAGRAGGRGDLKGEDLGLVRFPAQNFLRNDSSQKEQQCI